MTSTSSLTITNFNHNDPGLYEMINSPSLTSFNSFNGEDIDKNETAHSLFR